MEKIDCSEMDELAPRFWKKTRINTPLVNSHSRSIVVQQRRGIIISGVASYVEDSFKLQARYLPDSKLLKFTLFKKAFGSHRWSKIPVKPDNTILYSLLHHIKDVEPNNVDSVVDAYFSEFTQNVQENKA